MQQSRLKRIEALEARRRPPLLFVPEGRSPDDTEQLIERMCAARGVDRAKAPIVVYSELDLAL